ncbi:ABC transporter ATP-binding protein [Terracoccus luteus]|uniref:ABC-type glutathione transport system ATPase component n=1 Tax=Terracoccus luteus TaxID=53356 RepID=A0A495Y4D9_9MICO|nr:ATP-binding cassette domain-containing protein [Terracoccus luteus]MBB2986608.1 ABC-type glutathione transport system ATPase component [Terracoccus luteus]MCP2171803.1 ABC-type glutathione transport system ATPase component [Terracoccus luteus]RKT79358.1 oligopeptide transport system ATP-binding protein [Terracoccus luteus]
MTDTAPRGGPGPADGRTPLLECEDLVVTFPRGRGQEPFVAVDHASLTVGAGEVIGLVGESGSGKSTIARSVVGLQPLDSGTMRFEGKALGARRSVRERGRMQMVFQDPYGSLDPRMSIRGTLAEVVRRHSPLRGADVGRRCAELLDLVALPSALLDSRPAGMSGGQRQRVAIARALAAGPRLLVADEAVAALDVSVQAGIVNLLADLRHDVGLSILFISHDLSIVRTLCDRVAVIHLGRIVEEQACADLYENPQQEYTRALLSAIPRLHARREPA